MNRRRRRVERVIRVVNGELSLERQVREEISREFRTAVDSSGDEFGLSALAVASIDLVANQKGNPQSLLNILEEWNSEAPEHDVSGVSEQEAKAAEESLREVFGIKTSDGRPERRILERGGQAEELSRRVVKIIRYHYPNLVETNPPDAIAAAAVYIASQADGNNPPTIPELTNDFDVSSQRLRNLREEFNDRLGDRVGRSIGPAHDETGASVEELQEIEIGDDTVVEAAEQLPNATVVFGDVRNFTSIVELYEKSYGPVDELFDRVRDRIQEEGGTVDKFLGDGILAYWTDLNDPEPVLRSIRRVLNDELPKLRARTPFDLEMGFGVATGEFHRVEMESERTVFGSNVNLAARLEELCKEYQAKIIVDEQTHQSLPDSERAYRLPNQDMSGITDHPDVFALPADRDERPDPEEIRQFNRAVIDLANGYHSRALEFFASRYGDDDHSLNGALVQRLAHEVFDQFNRGETEDRPYQTLYEYTETEQKRSKKTIEAVNNHLSTSDSSSPRVLEVACASGELLAELAERWPEAEFVGIDPSPEAITRSNKEADDKENLRYERTGIVRFDPENRFDVVVLNSPLYSAGEYETTLNAIREIVNDDAVLISQQALREFEQPLREIARRTLERLDLSDRIESFIYPINFPDTQGVMSRLKESGWEGEINEHNIQISVDAYVESFVDEGLTPYTQQLSNDIEKHKFVNSFTGTANAELGQDMEPKPILMVEATPESD